MRSFHLRSGFLALIGYLLTLATSCLYAQPIAPEGLAQIEALLADKENRTPAEQKIDSTLLHAARVVAGQPMAAGFAAPTSNVNAFISDSVAPDKTVRVTVRGNVTSSLLNALASAGGTDVRSYPQYNRVTVRLPIASVLSVAQNPDVQFIGPVARPITNRPLADSPANQFMQRLQTLGQPITNIGAQTSEGVVAHGANLAQSMGINGAGLKICALSDSAYPASIMAAQSTGDLPSTVDVLENPAPGVGADEGTAMLEIVYDMAPGAALGFATAFISDVDFANNIVLLRNSPHNCDVIVDDVTYDNEGAFQDGLIASSVNTVVASGALYFSSAANSGNLRHSTSGTWEGDFVDGGAIGSPITGSGNFHKFGTNNFDVLNTHGFEITLQWSDPLGASANDYDLFLLDSTGTTVLASSTIVQSGTQDPMEFIVCNPSTVCKNGSHIVVVKRSGAAVRALRIDTMRGTLSLGTTGSTFGHNAAATAYTVAAVNASGRTTEFNTSNTVEPYSSDGPRQMFYNPNGTAITPGNVLFGTGGGTILNKVDISAADCVKTTLASFNPFCGTSAAAPHAAAIAALLKQANPSLTSAQMRTALTTGTIDIETAGFDVTAGNGIVMADRSLVAGLTPLTAGKSFSPNPILPGATSVLTITLNNSNSIAITGVAFTDTYPAGVVNSATPNPNITGAGCSGTLSATAGGNSLALSAGIVPAGITCSYKVIVTSSVAGVYLDAADTVTTPIALNSSAGAASLFVGSAPSITSAAGATFTVGSPGTFTVTATGSPAPTFTESGALPPNVTFNTTTGVLSGTPFAGTAGVYHITLGATNGIPPDAMQSFTLTINPSATTPIPLAKTDFNGDGKSDIFWKNPSAPSWIYTMNGATVVSSQPAPPAAPGWVLAGIGDFNGDGHADLLWKNTADPTQYWIFLMNGATVIGGGPLFVAAGYIPTQIGDFDGDGKSDILWENGTSSRWIYFMNGTTVTSSQPVPPAAPGWVIVGVGDFNGDGKTDLLWNNTANPTQYWIYLMNGASTIGGGGLVVAPGYVPTEIADFSGDAKADILWENGTASRWIYFMNGATVTSSAPAPVAAAGWTVVGTGDFNSDGRADLLWQNSASPTQYWIYLLNGTSVIGGGGLVAAPGYTPLDH
jgi:hypothetical protein